VVKVLHGLKDGRGEIDDIDISATAASARSAS
jgi:hypothetical protein